MEIKILDKEYFNKFNYLELIELLNSFYDFDPDFQRTLKPPSFKEFAEKFNEINRYCKSVIVLIDGKIIGYGKIIIESKIHANFTKIGHIEDVITHKDYRNKGIGKIIINKLVDVGKTHGCYKIVLFCKDDYRLFYEKCGFERSKNGMEKYIK